MQCVMRMGNSKGMYITPCNPDRQQKTNLETASRKSSKFTFESSLTIYRENTTKLLTMKAPITSFRDRHSKEDK